MATIVKTTKTLRHFSKYLLLFSTDKINSRFGMICACVNDRITFFRVDCPFKCPKTTLLHQCCLPIFLFHHIATLILLSSVRAHLRRVNGTPGPPPTALVARLPRTACVSHEARWAAALSTEASWGSVARPPITDPQPLQPFHTMPRRSHSPGAAGQQTSSQSSHPSSRAGKQTLHLNAIISNGIWFSVD